jgi:site-specific DNA recombinase
MSQGERAIAQRRSSGNGHRTARLADLQEQVARAEGRLAEVQQAIAERERDQFDEREIEAAFGDFDAVWGSLSTREQAEALSLLVARVEYDAVNSLVAVSFHDSGIKTLAATQGEDA